MVDRDAAAEPAVGVVLGAQPRHLPGAADPLRRGPQPQRHQQPRVGRGPARPLAPGPQRGVEAPTGPAARRRPRGCGPGAPAAAGPPASRAAATPAAGPAAAAAAEAATPHRTGRTPPLPPRHRAPRRGTALSRPCRPDSAPLGRRKRAKNSQALRPEGSRAGRMRFPSRDPSEQSSFGMTIQPSREGTTPHPTHASATFHISAGTGPTW